MLASVAEHERLIATRACDIIQPDAPRIGGITQFLHLAAAYPREPWVEHFDWLDPLFSERLETKDGRMIVPN